MSLPVLSAQRPALLALDAGTSVVRAALWRGGRVVAASRRELSLAFPAPHHVEQDANDIAVAARSVVDEAAAAATPGEAVVLGLCSQRSTVVLWDSVTGQPLGPALSWRDARARDEATRMARVVPDLERRTGLPPSPHYGAPKIAWALRHWPRAAEAAAQGRLRVGPVSTWIAWSLAGGASFVVDATNAQRLLLLDLVTLAWDHDLVGAIGLSAEALPTVVPTDGLDAVVRVGDRDAPLVVGLGDQQAVLAAGEVDASTARVQLGTGGFVLRGVGTEPVRVPGLLAGLARADRAAPRRHVVEGPVQAAGSAFDRLRGLGLLAADEDLDAACARARRPVTVVPAWAGLAAPWWEPRAAALLAGWDESSTREDVVAGTVNGIAFLVADVVDAMRGSGLAVRDLELTGSLSRSEAVAQALCDATGTTARVVDDPEASLRGLACALADATGGERPEPVPATRRLEPSRDLSRQRETFSSARDAALDLARAAP